MKIKTFLIAMIVLSLPIVLLTACGKSEFGVTESSGRQITIEAKNADEGGAFLTGSLEVAEAEQIVFSPSLEKGSVRVEIMKSSEEQSSDELPDLEGEAAFKTDLSNKKKELSGVLTPGDYMIKATCLKKASGTIRIKVETVAETVGEDGIKLSSDSSDFVLLSEEVPDAILEIRYYSTYNFVGDRIDGYEEPLAFLTKEAAQALKETSDDLKEKGYRLKIYDAYRPQKAVTNFMNWALDADDTRMKEYFYPELDKDVLFPQGYIAEHSGHSRGSTVDLTLFDMKTEKEVDMGGTFDYFGELSHPDYKGITDEQYENRMILRDAMTSHGFKPLEEEWWHFTLENEPYPETYFTFPINSEQLR